MRYVRNHPNDFTRIFRRCRACRIEIDHLTLKAEHCGPICRERTRTRARTPIERQVSCSVCLNDIPDDRPRSDYCSDRCNGIAYGNIRALELEPTTCALPECNETFQPWLPGQRCCSEQHGKRLYNRQSRADGRQQNPAWDDARRDRYHRRRAQQKAASTGEPVLLAEIAERDGWLCHLCGDPVDPKLVWPDVMSASLDHEISLSNGGAHDPSNVRLAHLSCNSAKGNRDGEALRILRR